MFTQLTTGKSRQKQADDTQSYISLPLTASQNQPPCNLTASQNQPCINTTCKFHCRNSPHHLQNFLQRKNMPSPRVYQVDTRYTSEKALEKKLRGIFPGRRASDFKIKVCCKMSSRSSCHCTDDSVNRW